MNCDARVSTSSGTSPSGKMNLRFDPVFSHKCLPLCICQGFHGWPSEYKTQRLLSFPCHNVSQLALQDLLPDLFIEWTHWLPYLGVGVNHSRIIPSIVSIELSSMNGCSSASLFSCWSCSGSGGGDVVLDMGWRSSLSSTGSAVFTTKPRLLRDIDIKCDITIFCHMRLWSLQGRKWRSICTKFLFNNTSDFLFENFI